MSTTTPTQTPGLTRTTSQPRPLVSGRRLSTETKRSSKTTELYVFLASVVGVLIASWAVKTADGHEDYFRADRAWTLIVVLSVGYMLSRGLAKSGSREPYTTQHEDERS